MKAFYSYCLVFVVISICSSKPSLVFRPTPLNDKSFEAVILRGFQRDMANLSNKYGKKLGLYHRPEKKPRAVDTLISNIETLSAAKCEGIFRYTLRVTLFTVRDKDEWRFLKY